MGSALRRMPTIYNAIWTNSKFLMVALVAISLHVAPQHAVAQQLSDQINIGADGIMRWRADGREVTGFGVNYTAPFAHAYRSGKKMGVDLKKAIDQDVYQFSRLGFDLFRVHVWDCEISDTLGNLLDNEHLELFDYLLYKLKERNINAIITPIAYWGNGWPEPDEPTPGFSSKYGKDKCLVDPEAIKAQENYLAQFVNHVNRYTGVAYKNEPGILSFEICNEPHHRGTPEQVTAFVRGMKEAIRSTGTTKPIFYNVTHGINYAADYYAAGIDGGTFQWYPTGLGFQKELGGNMLPNVDYYPIPFDDVLKKNGSARIVYEFDAADMASTYMYPAMARSFRSAGMQLATHFSYEASYLAPYNTEYNTHYMNLLYAPRKALSLMISAEVFRTIPLYTAYPPYPDNTSFGPFRISYEDDLAEMVTGSKYYYTNNTTTMPPDPDKLEHIAGWGNSPMVEYDGTGAYFLDKIVDGIWSLEVFPDATQVDNLFGRNSPDKRLVEISNEVHTMTINLPNLSRNYLISSLDFTQQLEYSKKSFSVRPGAYLLIFSGVDAKGEQKVKEYVANKKYSDYADTAVKTSVTKTTLIHLPREDCVQYRDLPVTASVVSPVVIDSVNLWYYKDSKLVSIKMKSGNSHTYSASIPGNDLRQLEYVKYYITVSGDHQMYSYPSGREIVPGQWNFDAVDSYRVRCIRDSSPIYLFNAGRDYDRLNREWLPESRLIPAKPNGADWLHLSIKDLAKTDPENPQGPKVADYSIRHYFGDLIESRRYDLRIMKNLVLRGDPAPDTKYPIQVSLVMKDGSAFGAIIKLKPKKYKYVVPLDKLERVKAVILPRPYPTFLPYYSKAGKADKLDISQIESLQISIGPGIKEKDVAKKRELVISSVYLER